MLDRGTPEGKKGARNGEENRSAPTISLRKGGGAIRGMGEKFAANPVMGTRSMSVSIATRSGRSGFGPRLSLSYDSGSANGPFGFGWSLTLPAITRKTEKGLPNYRDAGESDVFILSGGKDLLPEFEKDDVVAWVLDEDCKHGRPFLDAAPLEHTLKPYAPLLEPNPRAMKLPVNSYSANRALAILSEVEIELHQLALWTILCSRWPQLADYLAEHPSALEKMGQQENKAFPEELRALSVDPNVNQVVSDDSMGPSLNVETLGLCGRTRS